MYLNKVMLIGNLTRDPEQKSLPSGISVTKLGLATNRVYKDKDGNKQEDVEFHNLVAFGKQAETLAQYTKKGQQLYVEGRLKTSTWDKDDGSKAYKTEVIVENFQFGKSEKSQEADVNKTFQEISADDIPFD